MGRKGSLDKYAIEWDKTENKFLIIPKYRNGKTTPKFGLGNAELRLNPNHLPTKILKILTGESENTKLLPVSPISAKGMKRWEISLSAGAMIHKLITGYKGTTAEARYYEAHTHKLLYHNIDKEIKAGGRMIRHEEHTTLIVPPYINGEIRGSQASGARFRKDNVWGAGALITIQGEEAVAYTSDLLGVITEARRFGKEGDAIPVEAIAREGFDIQQQDLGTHFGSFMIRYSDGTVRLKSAIYDIPSERQLLYSGVGRLTEHGVYFTTGNYYKSSIGNTAALPFLSKKNHKFIISVIECQTGDALIEAENGGLRVTTPFGNSHKFNDNTIIAGVVSSSSGEYIITGTKGEYVVICVTDNVPDIECEYFGSLAVFTTPVNTVYVGVNGSTLYEGCPSPIATYDRWACAESSWAGYGETGHVVGGSASGGLTCVLEPSTKGGEVFKGYCPCYVVDGELHIMKKVGNFDVVEADTDGIIDLLYAGNHINKVAVCKTNELRYFINGRIGGFNFSFEGSNIEEIAPTDISELYSK